MKKYIGTKIIEAEPAYRVVDAEGNVRLQTQNTEAPKSRVPWLASQTDMLAEDWEIFA